MSNFFDKVSDFIHEASFNTQSYSSPMYNELRGFTSVDTPWRPSGGSGNMNDPMEQVGKQIGLTKKSRQQIQQQVDLIKDHHIATTIKGTIVNACFRSMCDKKFITTCYVSDDKEASERYNKDIEQLFKTTSFLKIFRDCLKSEGMNYGEFFLSSKCKVGRGIVEIGDDIDVKQHIAIYKGVKPVGFIGFDNDVDYEVIPRKYIAPDEISHFIVSPEKMSLSIKTGYLKEKNLPEKVRCAMPLLAPVVDLIIQYNQLEQLSAAVEINKALAPIIIGIGMSPVSDVNEVRSNIQQWQTALNSGRKAILANLATLDTRTLLEKMNEVMLVPYDVEQGANRLQQVAVDYVQSDLSEKLNNIRRSIALAIPVPESTLASTVVKEKKEENILFNPAFSNMLSSIQQSLEDGIAEFAYKHLKYKYSTYDQHGNIVLLRKIDKDCIETMFKSVTNLDDRLENENMLLLAEMLGSLTGIIDVVSGSPNLPVKTNGDCFIALWKKVTRNSPYELQNMFEIDKTLDNNPNDGFVDDINDPNYKQEDETPEDIDVEDIQQEDDEVNPGDIDTEQDNVENNTGNKENNTDNKESKTVKKSLDSFNHIRNLYN